MFEMFSDCPKTVHWDTDRPKSGLMPIYDSSRLSMVLGYPAQIKSLWEAFPQDNNISISSKLSGKDYEKRSRENLFSRHAKAMSEMLDEGKTLLHIAETFSTMEFTLRYYYCRKIIAKYRAANSLPERVQRAKSGPRKKNVRRPSVQSKIPKIKSMMGQVDPNTGKLYLTHRIASVLCMHHSTVTSCIRQIKETKGDITF